MPPPPKLQPDSP
jgi:hypothetical protein